MDSDGALGLDLGGTRLKAVALDRSGTVLARAASDSRAAQGPDGPLLAIGDVVRELRSRAGGALAIGLGCPGAIDPATGHLGGATPHLPHWTDFPLRGRATDLLGQ